MLYPLETIRFSITRLKQEVWNWINIAVVAWNNKILDYEIETEVNVQHNHGFLPAWNNKILDYEIETGTLLISVLVSRLFLKQ